MAEFTHFDKAGSAIMVDVTDKPVTERIARACGKIYVTQEILGKVKEGTMSKGDVLGVARIAGIMAAKRTSELIPLCHMLPLTSCKIDFELHAEQECSIEVFCTVKTNAKTGVEMEALTGTQIALLTIYDMCKAISKSMVISDIHLIEKSGGKSGAFRFGEE